MNNRDDLNKRRGNAINDAVGRLDNFADVTVRSFRDASSGRGKVPHLPKASHDLIHDVLRINR
jgi:hypothetical protein